MANEQELINKVWRLADVLASAGVGFTDYIIQLTYLLFLKMDDEAAALGRDSMLPADCRWRHLAALAGHDLLEAYEKALAHLAREAGLTDATAAEAFRALSVNAAMDGDDKGAALYANAAAKFRDATLKSSEITLRERAQTVKEEELKIAQEKLRILQAKEAKAVDAVSDAQLTDAERVEKVKSIFGIK